MIFLYLKRGPYVAVFHIVLDDGSRKKNVPGQFSLHPMMSIDFHDNPLFVKVKMDVKYYLLLVS